MSILRNAGVQPSAAAHPAPYHAGVAGGPSTGGTAGQSSLRADPAPAPWVEAAQAQGGGAQPDLLPPQLRELLGQLGQK